MCETVVLPLCDLCLCDCAWPCLPVHVILWGCMIICEAVTVDLCDYVWPGFQKCFGTTGCLNFVSPKFSETVWITPMSLWLSEPICDWSCMKLWHRVTDSRWLWEVMWLWHGKIGTMCGCEFWGLLAATPSLVLTPICCILPYTMVFHSSLLPTGWSPSSSNCHPGLALSTLLCFLPDFSIIWNLPHTDPCHTLSLRMCHPWVQKSPHTSQTESSHLRVTIISPRTKDRGGFRDPTVKEEGQCRKASLY